MTPEKIALVRSSWQQVLPIKDTAAQLFYGQLFELDPSLRSMFKGDMVEQGRKLMMIINTAVNSLDNLGPILGAVEDMGRRHVAYGVTEAHYDTVGSALIWTLGQGLGEQFTPAVKDAWVETYTTLASAMKQAAYATA
ncbi:MAG TPA: globin family protein [Thiobacillus sp.]|nr:MAG: hemin receptor [Hydrogenophilales bacterium 16-64-40]OZA34922.1 MAG: hemin receptor [Hydrogenophilales bacterium 17-64-65]HQS80976.1 globin family protein [Thiobacillus sp.]HQT34487.1 globin family protein [Thiobacillus sp.]